MSPHKHSRRYCTYKVNMWKDSTVKMFIFVFICFWFLERFISAYHCAVFFLFYFSFKKEKKRKLFFKIYSHCGQHIFKNAYFVCPFVLNAIILHCLVFISSPDPLPHVCFNSRIILRCGYWGMQEII